MPTTAPFKLDLHQALAAYDATDRAEQERFYDQLLTAFAPVVPFDEVAAVTEVDEGHVHASPYSSIVITVDRVWYDRDRNAWRFDGHAGETDDTDLVFNDNYKRVINDGGQRYRAVDPRHPLA